jgi:hypothetical protein
MHKVAIASDAIGANYAHAKFINLSEANPAFSAALLTVFDPSKVQTAEEIDKLFSEAGALAKKEWYRQDEPRRSAEYEATMKRVDVRLADLETNGIPDEMKEKLRAYLATNP